jgi:hypothetical protein
MVATARSGSAPTTWPHERGYPALLDVVGGLPVGALVIAQNAVAGDLRLGPGQRVQLDETRARSARPPSGCIPTRPPDHPAAHRPTTAKHVCVEATSPGRRPLPLRRLRVPLPRGRRHAAAACLQRPCPSVPHPRCPDGCQDRAGQGDRGNPRRVQCVEAADARPWASSRTCCCRRCGRSAWTPTGTSRPRVSLTPRRWPWPSGSPAFTWTRAWWRVRPAGRGDRSPAGRPSSVVPPGRRGRPGPRGRRPFPAGLAHPHLGPWQAPAFCESVWFVG